MHLLTDQDVYGTTIQWLKGAGHDVVTAHDVEMSQASDSDLLKKAAEMGRLQKWEGC